MGELVSRAELNYPLFGQTAGTDLNDDNKSMFLKLGDGSNSRLEEILSFANASTQEYRHNFRTRLTELIVKLYSINDTGSGPATSITLNDGGSITKANGTYVVTQASGNLTTTGTGTGLKLNVKIETNVIVKISINEGGIDHEVADTITINTVDSTAMTSDGSASIATVDGNQYTIINDLSNYVIAEKSGEEYTVLQITNNTGGPVDIALVIIQDSSKLSDIITSKVVSSGPYNAVDGEELFVDMSGGAFQVNLPEYAPIGTRVIIIDYGSTLGTNTLTISGNSNNINGSASNATMSTNGIKATFVSNGNSDYRMV